MNITAELLADLRKKAEAARDETDCVRPRDWDAESRKDGAISQMFDVIPRGEWPDLLLALLDRIEALERDALEVTGAFNERRSVEVEILTTQEGRALARATMEAKLAVDQYKAHVRDNQRHRAQRPKWFQWVVVHASACGCATCRAENPIRFSSPADP